MLHGDAPCCGISVEFSLMFSQRDRSCLLMICSVVGLPLLR